MTKTDHPREFLGRRPDVIEEASLQSAFAEPQVASQLTDLAVASGVMDFSACSQN